MFSQIAAWLVLLFVLYAIVTGRIRFEAAAFGGLLLLGLLGVSKPPSLFAGFSNPALFTIIAVLAMSDGIVASGALTGLGCWIARRVHRPQRQILALSLATGFLSALINNVGAIGLILPTARRMATRARLSQARYGMPLAFAAILGGSATLIGTASNQIVSSFRQSTMGMPFGMFDFSAHGLVLSLSALALWLLFHLLRHKKTVMADPATHEPKNASFDIPKPAPHNRKNTVIVSITLLIAIGLTAADIAHPAVAFALCAMIWIVTGVYTVQRAYKAINLPIFLFLGSMLSLSNILIDTGALQVVVNRIMPLLHGLPPYLLVLTVVYLSAVFANVLSNSVSAVLMAPAVVLLHSGGLTGVGLDVLLMAVAAGSSLSIVLPIHQAAMVTMAKTNFSRENYIKTGAVIALVGGALASLAIVLVWQ